MDDEKIPLAQFDHYETKCASVSYLHFTGELLYIISF